MVKKGIAILFILMSFCAAYTAHAYVHNYNSDTAEVNQQIKVGEKIFDENLDSAINLFYTAAEKSKKIGYTDGAIRGLAGLGKAYFYARDFDKALETFFAELSLCDTENRKKYGSRIYQGIGMTYSSKGNCAEATSYYLKAIEIIESKIKPEQWSDSVNTEEFADLVRSYNNLADFFNHSHQWERTIFYLRKAEYIARLKKNYEGLCWTLNNLTEAFLNLNESRKNGDSLTSAEKVATEALDIADKYNIPIARQMSYNALGDVYERKKDYEKAVHFYNMAIGDGKLAELKATAMISLSNLYIHQHQYELAERILKDAESFEQKDRTGRYLGDIYTGLKDLYMARGDYKNAFNALSRVMNINDSAIAEERKNDINLLETRFRVAQKDKDLLRNELLIARQQAKINRKNVIIYSSVAVTAFVILFSVFLYMRKQRVQAEKIKALKDEEKIKMLLSVVKGEEQERNRLAGELHDGIGGLLSTVKMFFSNLEKKDNHLAANPDFMEAMNLLNDTITEVRKTAHNLMPEIFFNYGLPEATKLFCDTFQKANNIKVNFQYYGFIGRLNRSFELFLYRIIQELLQNVSKHAQATEALVQISLHDTTLSITIEDNGIGIQDINTGKEGMGLKIIRSRITDLDGQFTVNSSEKGTSIYIELDIKSQEKFAPKADGAAAQSYYS